MSLGQVVEIFNFGLHFPPIMDKSNSEWMERKRQREKVKVEFSENQLEFQLDHSIPLSKKDGVDYWVEVV